MPAKWNNAPKDPDAIRDYGMDWSADIGAATIVGSTWTVVEGTAHIVTSSYTTTGTTVRVSGGTAGETCKLKNHIVLSDSEEDEFTGSLAITQR